jgi:hypothetical protein
LDMMVALVENTIDLLHKGLVFFYNSLTQFFKSRYWDLGSCILLYRILNILVEVVYHTNYS